MDILKELQELEKNYPQTYKWIEGKAKWEGITLSSVLIYYEKDIQKMLEVNLKERTLALLGLFIEEGEDK